MGMNYVFFPTSIFDPNRSFTWTVPSNWNNTSNTISCIGAGGNGNGQGSDGTVAGGGGGAFASITNLTLTPGSQIPIVIGENGTNNGDTYFLSTSTVLAKGGQNSYAQVIAPGVTTAHYGLGGSAANSVGTVKYSGGNGAYGGGGAAGPNGNGVNAGITGTYNGGAGDAGFGGSGGIQGHGGSNGFEFNNYAGSGGGGGENAGGGFFGGGAGANGGGTPGLLVISWFVPPSFPFPTGSISSSDIVNTWNNSHSTGQITYSASSWKGLTIYNADGTAYTVSQSPNWNEFRGRFALG